MLRNYAARLSILGPAVLLISVVITTSANPEYNHLRSPLSRLIIEGDYGWLINFGLIFFSFTSILFAYPIQHHLKKEGSPQISIFTPALVICFGLSCFLSAIFQDDLDSGGIFIPNSTGEVYLQGIIHDLSARLSFFFLFLMIIFISFHSSYIRKHRSVLVVSIAIIIISAISATFFLFTSLQPLQNNLWNIFGLFQKGALIPGIIWIQMMSIILIQDV